MLHARSTCAPIKCKIRTDCAHCFDSCSLIYHESAPRSWSKQQSFKVNLNLKEAKLENFNLNLNSLRLLNLEWASERSNACKLFLLRLSWWRPKYSKAPLKFAIRFNIHRALQQQNKWKHDTEQAQSCNFPNICLYFKFPPLFHFWNAIVTAAKATMLPESNFHALANTCASSWLN